MSYIGRSPQIGAYSKLDAITTDGSASYTMQLNSANFVPESVNHLIVSVNGVIQAPTDSFTVSGSTITFASSLSVSDTIDFIMALGNVLDIGVPSDNTVSLSKLTATGTPSASTFLRGDNSWASAGGTNTPNFSAFITTSQSVDTGTLTKMQFGSEEFDSDNAFDSTTNYRFTVPSGKGGKYLIGAQLEIDTVDDSERIEIKVFKNGTEDQKARNFQYSPISSRELFIQTTTMMNLNAGDYVELYSQHNQGSTRTYYGSHSRFYGFKLVE